jgi:hypothetical protein
MSNINESLTRWNKSEPFELQVARGQIRGHQSLNISGYQASVDGGFIPIWENATAYTYPTSAIQMTLYSSSASDTAVSILINGLDSNYDPISETLILTNGTTGVTTVNSYFRINSIAVVGTVNPVGTISLTNSAKTVTYAKITNGNGRSSMTVYTVPKGYTFYLAKVNCYTHSSNNQLTTYRAYTINPNGIVNAVLQAPFTEVYISDKSVPRPYIEKTDCQWQCTSTQLSAVGLQIEGILIKNQE